MSVRVRPLAPIWPYRLVARLTAVYGASGVRFSLRSPSRLDSLVVKFALGTGEFRVRFSVEAPDMSH